MPEDNSILIAYALNNSPIDGFAWRKKIERLPEKIKKRCNRFQRWQDRQACIIGKMLLSECLEKNNFSRDLLNELQSDANGKPFIDREVCFNISHGEGCVVCAFARGHQRIGIDIEKISTVNPKEFESALGTSMIEEICRAPDPAKQFYRFWTAIESALKADGRGFLFDLGNIRIDWNAGLAEIERNRWYLTPIDIAPKFVCHLSSSAKGRRMEIYHSQIANDMQVESCEFSWQRKASI